MLHQLPPHALQYCTPSRLSQGLPDALHVTWFWQIVTWLISGRQTWKLFDRVLTRRDLFHHYVRARFFECLWMTARTRSQTDMMLNWTKLTLDKSTSKLVELQRKIIIYKYNSRNKAVHNVITHNHDTLTVWTAMHLMMITQTRVQVQVSVQVTSTLAIQNTMSTLSLSVSSHKVQNIKWTNEE